MQMKLGAMIALMFGAYAPVTVSAEEAVLPDTDYRGVVISEPTWVLERTRTVGVDSSDAGNGTDFVAEQQWLVLKGAGNSAITLSCQEIMGDADARVRLQVAFDLDKQKDISKSRMRLRQVTGRLTLGDNSSKSERFLWNTQTMKVVPNSRNVARRVFNAAVRGDHIKLKVSGKTYYDFKLPELNDDFRAFVKVCPAVQPKAK